MNVSTRIALTAAAVVTLGVTTTVPALAAAPRGPETGATGPAGSAVTAAYAEALAPLGGRTLAQYLADHQAGAPRLG
jgi:hypothetical protein